MIYLLWRDVWHHRGRLIGVVILMGIVLGLLFLMTGLVGQFRTEPREAALRAGSGNDWLLPEGARGPFTSGEALIADDEVIAAGAVPIFVTRASMDAEPIYLISRASLSEPPIVEGRSYAGPNEAIVDETADVEIGDVVRIGTEDVVVVGLTHRSTVLAGVPLVFTDLETGQSAVATGRPILSGYLASDPTMNTPPGLIRRTQNEIGDDAARPLDDAVGSVDLVRSLLWLITAIVIAAIMYITALERTRETAVLKACGVPMKRLGLEMLLRALGLTAAGVVLAAVFQAGMRPAFPLAVRIPGIAWVYVPIAALAIAGLASVAALRYVSRIPPEEAFS